MVGSSTGSVTCCAVADAVAVAVGDADAVAVAVAETDAYRGCFLRVTWIVTSPEIFERHARRTLVM